MSKHIFLDLEDTIITSVITKFSDVELINVNSIKTFIEQEKPDIVSIFSFALWDDCDVKAFKEHCLPMIEDALSIKIHLIPSMHDKIIPSCCHQRKMTPSSVDVSDTIAFWSKDLSFLLCMKEWYPRGNTHCILIDDIVDDVEMHFKQNDLRVSMVNVNSLPL